MCRSPLDGARVREDLKFLEVSALFAQNQRRTRLGIGRGPLPGTPPAVLRR